MSGWKKGGVGREVQETTPPSNVLALSRPRLAPFHSTHLQKIFVFPGNRSPDESLVE